MLQTKSPPELPVVAFSVHRSLNAYRVISALPAVDADRPEPGLLPPIDFSFPPTACPAFMPIRPPTRPIAPPPAKTAPPTAAPPAPPTLPIEPVNPANSAAIVTACLMNAAIPMADRSMIINRLPKRRPKQWEAHRGGPNG